MYGVPHPISSLTTQLLSTRMYLWTLLLLSNLSSSLSISPYVKNPSPNHVTSHQAAEPLFDSHDRYLRLHWMQPLIKTPIHSWPPVQYSGRTSRSEMKSKNRNHQEQITYFWNKWQYKWQMQNSHPMERVSAIATECKYLKITFDSWWCRRAGNVLFHCY